METRNEQIKKGIIRRLTMLSNKRYSNIHVCVDNGWVVISGSVKNKVDREVVEKVASNVLGVQTVINKITIVPTHDELDESIANEIVDAIDENEDINVEHVVVQVKEHVVTIEGTVPTWMSKDKAYQVAHSINHAKEIFTINNELKVSHV